MKGHSYPPYNRNRIISTDLQYLIFQKKEKNPPRFVTDPYRKQTIPHLGILLKSSEPYKATGIRLCLLKVNTGNDSQKPLI